MAKLKKAKKESRSTWKGDKSAKKNQKPRPRRGGMIPLTVVAAQKVHHLVHPAHNQRISSSTGTEKKNMKDHLTMKMPMKTKRKK